MLCGPWLDLEALPDGLCANCSAADFAEGVLASKILEGSHLLYMASGRQFGGLCEDHIEPCEERPVGSVPVTWNGGWPTFGAFTNAGGGCGCSGAASCTLGAVVFPYTPVRSVESVTIAGEDLDPSAYQIWNGRWLVRTDGGRWPCSQSPEWSIAYTWGNVPDIAGLGALLALACEMARACTPGMSCALPERIRTLTTEGTTIDVADPLEFLQDGRFGFYPVDLWLSQVNPAQIDRPAKVLNVDLLGDTYRH